MDIIMSNAQPHERAIPFTNPFTPNPATNITGNKLYIEPAAQHFFNGMNNYEQMAVAKGIDALRSIKQPLDGASHKLRPNFFKLKKDPGVAGNYLIGYEIFSKRVVVTSIKFNRNILFKQPNTNNERNANYLVERTNNTRFTNKFMPSRENMNDLKSSWGSEARPVTHINTTHAAVNGMLNDFKKAVWLMGTHVDYAYQEDNVGDYTLFHNPTETLWPDLYECTRDQIGITTENAKHLAAVLAQVQRSGKPVKWVVHSQGGIIFTQAVKYHLKSQLGSLHHNSVIFHSGGHKKRVTERILCEAGIKKLKPDNDNPFDAVPNLAGMNDFSKSSIQRSLRFAKKVAGKKDIPKAWPHNHEAMETESPHTLPFISLEFYRRMLIHGGEYELAKKVSTHINEMGIA
jgi:hypothetical protein